MTTLLNTVEVASNALMTGEYSSVKLVPSLRKGIRFIVDGVSITANLENVARTDHCVTLGVGSTTISLVEHFMAACAICQIDALDVYCSTNELPILDGSSKTWVEKFDEVGIEYSMRDRWCLKAPVSYLNGKTHLVILPSDKLEISYAVNYNHPDLKNRWVSYSPDKLHEIKEARTFGYLSELEMLQAHGFGRGVTYENTVGMKDDGTYTCELRSEFEPAKHKMLDLIGDLYLTGVNPLMLKAHIIVKEAGHTVHVKAANLLKEKLVKE